MTLRVVDPQGYVSDASLVERCRRHDRAAEGRDVWAALALYSLAELELGRRRREGALSARTAAADYLARFPGGTYAAKAAAMTGGR